MAAEIAAGMFGDWVAGITERCRRLGAVVTVATTEFTVEFLAQVWPTVEEEFTRREIKLNIVHVRTRDFRSRLHIAAEFDSIYYGLALLRSRLVHGALIATGAAAQAAVEGRLSGGPGLRLIPLASGFSPPLQILAGIFARKGERALYHPEHPLNLLWNAFDEHAASHS